MPEAVDILPSRFPARPPRGGRCFHCGEPCPDDAYGAGRQAFCCFGCQTVFSLLRENGLEQFYQLQSAPGTRIRAAATAAKWAFLDDPAVRGTISRLCGSDAGEGHVASAGDPLCRLRLAAGKSVQTASGHRPFAGEFFAARGGHHFCAGPDQIQRTGGAAGFHRLRAGTDAGRDGENRRRRCAKKPGCRSAWPAFAFGNIMLMSLPFYFGLDRFNGPWFKAAGRLAGLAFALPVVTYSAADFWRAAWPACGSGRSRWRFPSRSAWRRFTASIVRSAVAARPRLLRFAVRPDFLSAVRPAVPEKNLRPAHV